MKDRSDKNDFELIVEMPEEMVAFLDKLVAQLKNQGIHQISRASLVETIMEVFVDNHDVDISGIGNEEELIQKILEPSLNRSLRRS